VSWDICNAFLEGADFRWLRYTAGSTGNNPCPPKTNYSPFLATVIDSNTGRDFVNSKSIKNMQITGDDVAFDVELGYPAKSQIPA
jgi:hypothetical protein